MQTVAMETRKNVKGTALIVVLLMISFVVIVATTVFRSGTLLCELALDRVEQTRQQYALQALALYGIAYCKKLANDNNQPKNYDYTFDQWPIQAGPYQGVLAISAQNRGYLVKAVLARQDEQLGVVESEIGLQKGVWSILSWKVL